jgi:hypothetical protein
MPSSLLHPTGETAKPAPALVTHLNPTLLSSRIELFAEFGKLSPHLRRRAIKPLLRSLLALGICHIASAAVCSSISTIRLAIVSTIRLPAVLLGRLPRRYYPVKNIIQPLLLVGPIHCKVLIHSLLHSPSPLTTASVEKCPALILRHRIHTLAKIAAQLVPLGVGQISI